MLIKYIPNMNFFLTTMERTAVKLALDVMIVAKRNKLGAAFQLLRDKLIVL